MSSTTHPNISVLGQHVLLELYECPIDLLRSPMHNERVLLAAATALGAQVIESRFHTFSPYGNSGVVIIAESHLTIHTWPEYGYAAVDVFSCGELDLAAGIEELKTGFQAKRSEERYIERGINLSEI